MSWKTRYLEAENARLRTDNRLLLAALLERAGHRTAAEMIRATPEAPTMRVTFGADEVSKPAKQPEPDVPVGRGWRNLRQAWQTLFAQEPAKDGEKTDA